MRHRIGGAALLALFLGLAGCNDRSGAAQPCSSDWPFGQCSSGFYCSQVDVCTRRCQQASDCRLACTVGDGGTSSCSSNDRCVSGVCESTLASVCLDNYCQDACAATDAGCDYDPYGPRT